MKPLEKAIRCCNGQTGLAEAIGGDVKQQHVWNWLNRADGAVPAEHCPAIERGTGGQVTVGELRADVNWLRVPDAEWPHPEGRPCIDVAAPAAQEAA